MKTKKLFSSSQKILHDFREVIRVELRGQSTLQGCCSIETTTSSSSNANPKYWSSSCKKKKEKEKLSDLSSRGSGSVR
jgi:hypothetical protein